MLYKKIALLLGCVGFCFITSCNFVSSVGSILLGEQSESEWSGSTDSITYDGTKVQFELLKGVRTLNIQTNGPVDVFMAKMNFSSRALSAGCCGEDYADEQGCGTRWHGPSRKSP